MKKKTFKSIKSKWLASSLSLLFISLVILEILFGIFIKAFFYSGVRNNIDNASSIFANVLSRYNLKEINVFKDAAKNQIENLSTKSMWVSVFDYNDDLVVSSIGLDVPGDKYCNDYMQARKQKNNYGFMEGRTASGEKVMAVTRAVYNNDVYLGTVRYVVSLRNVDKIIRTTLFAAILIGLIVVLCMMISSSYFIKSIVTTISQVCEAAKRIARGNFSVKLEKKSNDEIGELCDSINYMSDELETSEKLKNDFISSVSHELRTPLTAIKGWAETMNVSLDVKDEILNRGIHIIIKESERLYEMVEELLDFSRLQGGRMVLKIEDVDPILELSEVVYMMQDKAHNEGKEIIYSFKNDMPIYTIEGDRNRLKQVFLNVIDNAVKYTNKGGKIHVSVCEKNGWLFVSVNDDGCGIPAEHLPYVKNKFYKANQTRRGSGIGLAVATEIIEMHGGDLTIESTENVGTTVIMKLPLSK